MSPKMNNIGSGSNGHVPNPKNGFSVFPTMNSKRYLAKMKQNNSTELSGRINYGH